MRLSNDLGKYNIFGQNRKELLSKDQIPYNKKS